jgi:phenylalanyl-tRNA synthetase beta chain
VPAGDLAAAIREAGGEELREVRFLSDYRGDQIGAGKKSIAFAVSFQSAERTLADEDGKRLRDRIVDALAGRFGAALRS